MPIDFERAPFVRQYRDEQGSFRALPVLAKAMAAYLRILVDPLHGSAQPRRGGLRRRARFARSIPRTR